MFVIIELFLLSLTAETL